MSSRVDLVCFNGKLYVEGGKLHVVCQLIVSGKGAKGGEERERENTIQKEVSMTVTVFGVDMGMETLQLDKNMLEKIAVSFLGFPLVHLRCSFHSVSTFLSSHFSSFSFSVFLNGACKLLSA